jgi:hypothetical protein
MRSAEPDPNIRRRSRLERLSSASWLSSHQPTPPRAVFWLNAARLARVSADKKAAGHADGRDVMIDDHQAARPSQAFSPAAFVGLSIARTSASRRSSSRMISTMRSACRCFLSGALSTGRSMLSMAWPSGMSSARSFAIRALPASGAPNDQATVRNTLMAVRHRLARESQCRTPRTNQRRPLGFPCASAASRAPTRLVSSRTPILVQGHSMRFPVPYILIFFCS